MDYSKEENFLSLCSLIAETSYKKDIPSDVAVIQVCKENNVEHLIQDVRQFIFKICSADIDDIFPKYTELDKLAESLVEPVLQLIQEKTKNIKSACDNKEEYVLEELITFLRNV